MQTEMAARPPGTITTRGEFHAAIRSALAEAAASGPHELWLVDPDFADWPLSEPAVIESLQAWARSHRKLTLLAETFDEVERRHARWSQWRRPWAHIVECRRNAELEQGRMPSALLGSGLVSVRLLDRVHHRGVVSWQAADHIRCREAIDAVLQRSVEAFPVTTLGL